jgi:diguanylate cyclase (GGDEF)-like protein/PAS domain S-box-containing protein
MNRLDYLDHSLIHDCADAIIARTLSGTMVSWNEAARRIFGYAEKEVLGHSIAMLVPEEKLGEEAELMARALRGECITDWSTTRLHKDGSELAVLLTVSPIHDAAGNLIGSSKIVRTALQGLARQQELYSLAYRDQLTGVANRTLLIDRLGQAMRRDERSRFHGGIIFIDLDDFKRVNDTGGHLAGDKVLSICARRLQAVLRECDTVARWGGDEFVVLVEDLHRDLHEALGIVHNIASKLLMTLRKPYLVGSATYRCPPSIGGCLFRGVTQPIEQVIHSADQAMYQAKMAGKNAVYINADKPRDAVEIVHSHAAVA